MLLLCLELFYEENLSQKQIVEKLNVSKAYVSLIVTKDERYSSFKMLKLEQSKIRHNQQIQKKVKENRKKVQFTNAVDDLFLKKRHEDASKEMSKGNHLTNENYRKWNQSAYKINPSKNRYEWDETLTRSYALPKYIKER